MKKKDSYVQIQLELPDYSLQYYEYLKKQEEEKRLKDSKKDETVIIIDIY